MPLDEATIVSLLAAQGYSAPSEDVAEICLRLNDLYEQTRVWDEYLPYDDEPWTFTPAVRGYE